MSAAEQRAWWRVVLEWKLDSEDTGTRYAYVTKTTEAEAMREALLALIDPSTFGPGDTIRVLSCDPHARTSSCKAGELTEVP